MLELKAFQKKTKTVFAIQFDRAAAEAGAALPPGVEAVAHGGEAYSILDLSRVREAVADKRWILYGAEGQAICCIPDSEMQSVWEPVPLPSREALLDRVKELQYRTEELEARAVAAESALHEAEERAASAVATLDQPPAEIAPAEPAVPSPHDPVAEPAPPTHPYPQSEQ